MMKAKVYNEKVMELARGLMDADLDTIKQAVQYQTGEEGGYALGCDYDKVLTDVLWQMRCL